MNQINIKDIDKKELQNYFEKSGQPKFRFKQFTDAVFKQKKIDWDSITTLPKNFKSEMAEKYSLNSLQLEDQQVSFDGSTKLLFSTRWGGKIETVYMPQENASNPRKTLCISTMTGCPVGCIFCETGGLTGYKNLTVSEIIDQVFNTEKILGFDMTNIVIMGMGEPLLNFDNTLKAIAIFCDPEYKHFSKRKITLSTVGVKGTIRRLADSEYPVKLAISLHATTNKTRDELIPVNKSFKIRDILSDAEYYYRKSKIPISYEYICFKDINDTDEDVNRMLKIGRRVPSKFNFIPMNSIENDIFCRKKQIFFSGEQKVFNIVERLKKEGIHATIRRSYGSDIAAACGQLAAKLRK